MTLVEKCYPCNARHRICAGLQSLRPAAKRASVYSNDSTRSKRQTTCRHRALSENTAQLSRYTLSGAIHEDRHEPAAVDRRTSPRNTSRCSRKLKAAGFDGVEIPLFGGDAGPLQADPPGTRQAGLGCTTVTIVDAGGQPDQPRRRRPPEGRRATVKWAIEMNHVLGGENLCGPYHSPLGVFSGSRPDRRREEAGGRRAAPGRRVSPSRRKVTLCIEYLNRFECYFLTTAAGRQGAGEGGQSPELPHDVRHLPRQHRGEEPSPATIQTVAAGARPRPHQRERPRHARHRAGALGRDVQDAARRWATTAGW